MLVDVFEVNKIGLIVRTQANFLSISKNEHSIDATSKLVGLILLAFCKQKVGVIRNLMCKSNANDFYPFLTMDA